MQNRTCTEPLSCGHFGFSVGGLRWGILALSFVGQVGAKLGPSFGAHLGPSGEGLVGATVRWPSC